MPVTIAALGRDGPPSKMSEGYFRFLCPHCGEMRATVNPRNNLAHCFSCKKNLNNIDLLITLGLRLPLRRRPPRTLAQSIPGPASEIEEPAAAPFVGNCPMPGRSQRNPTRVMTRSNAVALSFSKILSNSGNRPSVPQNPYSLNLGKLAIRLWFGTTRTPNTAVYKLTPFLLSDRPKIPPML